MTRGRKVRVRARFNPAFPASFPRFIQQAIWGFCAQDGLAGVIGARHEAVATAIAAHSPGESVHIQARVTRDRTCSLFGE